MARRSDKVELQHGVEEVLGSPGALFLARALERGARRVVVDNWATTATTLEALGDTELRVRAHGHEQALLERDGVLVHVTLGGGRVGVTVAEDAAEKIHASLAWLHDHLPAPDPTSGHEVTVTFWTYGPHGPQPSSRTIAVPGWDEIEENYAAATREKLEALMRGFEPARGGQLILWHGRAGTGKTFGLRALAWEWRDWCEFHYIVDPDSFFGQHADYLMNVLLQPTWMEMPLHLGYQHVVPGDEIVLDQPGEDGGAAPKPWKLLMLEDTGELLTADARAVIGQGLSRFLNVVDGLIGQGLRVLVLVTTNEEIKKLHPAVGRPGRCAANVEFVPLSEDEARRWFERHGVEATPRGGMTLASLYARAAGLDPDELHAPGFAP